MSMLFTLVPIFLKLLALIFGGGAAVSAQRLGASPDATLQHWLTFVGSYGGLAAASWGSGELTAWINRARASKSIDWSKVVSQVGGINGVNLLSLFKLIARVFQLVSQDAEAKKLWQETFGVAPSALPHDANQIATFALVNKGAH